MDHISTTSSGSSVKRGRGRPPVLSIDEQLLSPKEKQQIYYKRYRDKKRDKQSRKERLHQWSNTEIEHINILRRLGHLDDSDGN